MRLDHVSYVTSHEQLADTVQRLGSLIGSAFVDGGIHPRFGTRNFTCALKNKQYIEVVCPLDHPATEESLWGKAVKKKAEEGGGWFSWVFRTESLTAIEERFERKAVEAHRTRPDGSNLVWKQIGVREIVEAPQLPFFIQWLTSDHPSQNGVATAKIKKLVISDDKQFQSSWFKNEITEALRGVSIEWLKPNENDGQSGIVSIHIESKLGSIELI